MGLDNRPVDIQYHIHYTWSTLSLERSLQGSGRIIFPTTAEEQLVVVAVIELEELQPEHSEPPLQEQVVELP